MSSRRPTPVPCPLRPAPSGERGFTLAALIVIATIILVFASYTVPRYWSTVMQREREQETIFAMRQYARAIKLFFDKNKTYPVSMEQLAKARQPRLLRGGKDGIPDPLTGEMDWLLVPAAAAGQQPAGIRPVPTPGQAPQTPQTIPALPMKDYAGGPFIGVRPPKTGKSLLSLNGADQYEQWTFTYTELKAEVDARALAAGVIYR